MRASWPRTAATRPGIGRRSTPPITSTPFPIPRRSTPRACASSRAARASICGTARARRSSDGMSGLWCVQVGYGNAELAEAGCEALKTLPYYNHFFKTSNPWTIELAAKLATLLPDGHDRILFANSGSEANDTELKLVRYYWNLKDKPEKKIHLSRDYAYHGVTFAAASLSG
ncbi:MAG: aminotransferase class III-fold pyridoxal phosphate-dependent enzyme [Rhizomicrobium sp.]